MIKGKYLRTIYIIKIIFLNIGIKINKYRFLWGCNFKNEKRGKDKDPAY